MNEGIVIEGGYSTLRAWEKGKPYIGKPVYENTVHNLIVTVGKNHFGDWLIGDVTVPFTYHAIGIDDEPPAVGQTTLESEHARKAFTSRTRTGNIVTLSCYYTAAECTCEVEECGIFGDSTATAAADSGVMLSRYRQTYDNSGGTYDLTFDYVLTIG